MLENIILVRPGIESSGGYSDREQEERAYKEDRNDLWRR